MIKFSVRGHEFGFTQKLLEKYPRLSLHIISNNNFPVNRLGDCVYIDINPLAIESIMEYLTKQ